MCTPVVILPLGISERLARMKNEAPVDSSLPFILLRYFWRVLLVQSIGWRGLVRHDGKESNRTIENPYDKYKPNNFEWSFLAANLFHTFHEKVEHQID